MMTEVVLLPGWGLGCAPLEPLAEALREQGFSVQLSPLPGRATGQISTWLDELEHRCTQNAWLLGWSLGGQLATLLAARRAERCPGLITLASNPCFVQREDWPCAMAQDTFKSFAEHLQQAPQATVRRFALLCAQGDEQPRALSKRLQQDGCSDPEVLQAGLHFLSELDTRKTLQHIKCSQLHLLAEQDQLVPQELAQAVRYLVPQAQIELRAGAHAALLFDEAVAVRIARFIREHS